MGIRPIQYLLLPNSMWTIDLQTQMHQMHGLDLVSQCICGTVHYALSVQYSKDGIVIRCPCIDLCWIIADRCNKGMLNGLLYLTPILTTLQEQHEVVNLVCDWLCARSEDLFPVCVELDHLTSSFAYSALLPEVGIANHGAPLSIYTTIARNA